MGASASLRISQLTVAPGSEVATELVVRNTGGVVDQFTFQPLGAVAGWMVVDPPTIPLFPAAEATVRVSFRPPRSPSSAAGVAPFAVRVLSREDPEGSVVEEGTIAVEPFDERALELVPKTARGRRAARYDVAIDNKGNARIAPRLGGTDPQQQLRFDFAPPALSIDPGTAQFARLRVRPTKRFWRGPPKTHAFQVVAAEDGREPVVADAAMLQEPVLPPWFWRAVIAFAALVLVLVVLWFTLLKPTIKSTAKDAVKAPLDQVTKRLDNAGVPAAPGGGKGGGGGAPTGNPAGGASGTGVAVSPNPFSGDPVNKRLAPANAAPGGSDSATYTVPAKKVFSLTDIVLENPSGDTGRISILQGSAVLFVSALDNFRDLDFHFVAPFVFKAGDPPLTVTVTCKTSGDPAISPNCTAAATVAGYQRANI